MNILNDKRLLLCAQLVKGKKAADIGTDHGYLPAFLVSEGICESAVAADINKMPLESAKKTVISLGLSDKISLVLSDGLKDVDLSDVTDIIIAGMGGELIARIIDDCKALKSGSYHLILQPMTRPSELREYLYSNGFEVREERCTHEGRFDYSVMSVYYIGGKPEYENDSRYKIFGRIDLADKNSRAYAEDRLKKLTAAANGMLKGEESRAMGESLMKTADELADLLKQRGGKNDTCA